MRRLGAWHNIPSTNNLIEPKYQSIRRSGGFQILPKGYLPDSLTHFWSVLLRYVNLSVLNNFVVMIILDVGNIVVSLDDRKDKNSFRSPFWLHGWGRIENILSCWWGTYFWYLFCDPSVKELMCKKCWDSRYQNEMNIINTISNITHTIH